MANGFSLFPEGPPQVQLSPLDLQSFQGGPPSSSPIDLAALSQFMAGPQGGSQDNFLANLGMVMQMIAEGFGGPPARAVHTYNQLQTRRAVQSEHQRKATEAQRKQYGLSLIAQALQGQGSLDWNSLLALTTQVDPELVKEWMKPEFMERQEMAGRMKSAGPHRARVAQQTAGAITPQAGQLYDVKTGKEGTSVQLQQPGTTEGLMASAIAAKGGTADEILAQARETTRPLLSEANLHQEIDRKIGRIQDIDKMLIGSAAGDPVKQYAMMAFGPAQGIEKLKLKIERQRLAADVQASENRRAELAQRQGFPDEQPRRLFSSPILGRNELLEGASREFLANLGIKWDAGQPKPYLPPDAKAKLQQFLESELGGFE